MVGLLDWLGFGPSPSPTGYGVPTQPDMGPSQGFNSQSFGQGLLGLGAGIAGSPRGQWLGGGLLGLNQGLQQGQQAQRQRAQDQMVMAEWQAKQQELQRQQQLRQQQSAALDRLVPGADTSAMGGSGNDPLANPTGYAPPQAQPAQAQPQIPPNVAQAIQAARASGDDAGALKLYQDFLLNQQKPVVLSDGASLVDPVTGKMIAENQKPFTPNIQTLVQGTNESQGYFDQSGKWVGMGSGPRFQPPQGPTTASVITLLMPDGKYKSFTNSDVKGIQEAVAGGAIEPQRNGLVVETAPDGTQTISMGGASPSGLTKTTQSDIQGALVSTGAKIASTNQIIQSFQPMYQQIGTKFDMAVASVKDKLGMPLDTDTQKSLADYSTFVANTGQNLSQVVKELAGSAVTPSEAKRILTYVPNAGTGLTDGDSPTVFKSKLDNFMKSLKMAQARLSYIQRNQNLSIDNVPLESMPQIMQNRGEELEQQFKGKGLEGDALKAAVTNQLAQEFGLVGQ